tara:strand:- start:97 stop:528 length:432 start_codon:yes stop_codon:yes gene_type:complete
MTNQVKNIKINYSEYAYFTTLSDHEKLNYFFQLFEGETAKPKLDLKEFFSQIDTNFNDDESKIHINKEIPDEHNRVDIMIDDEFIMIESNSLKAIRIIMTRFMESGYIVSRNKETEKIFKIDKTTRYIRVYSIIDQTIGFCLS